VLAGLVVLAVVLAAGLTPGSGRRLDNAAAGWIAVGAALEVCACVSYGALVHHVFSGAGHRLAFLRSTQIGVGPRGGVATPRGGACTKNRH